MFALYLNPMMSNTEVSICVTRADTITQLEEFLTQERVEPYREKSPSQFHDGEQSFYKVFKKDGPLEMFNPPETSFCAPVGIIEIPSIEEIEMYHRGQLEEATYLWNMQFGHVPILFKALYTWQPVH